MSNISLQKSLRVYNYIMPQERLKKLSGKRRTPKKKHPWRNSKFSPARKKLDPAGYFIYFFETRDRIVVKNIKNKKLVNR